MVWDLWWWRGSGKTLQLVDGYQSQALHIGYSDFIKDRKLRTSFHAYAKLTVDVQRYNNI
ncbi:hypothetical protein K2173_019629 [Erythroxylum novogranatense]|uniref:Uncharacterized protein n=1 Tax=Erythroxylum novogranatense TaxID=1862640 RepID=A0AAV8S575_9ROSI|nr:hypothetical protein K2173_019629 [Erythroxylum novogranatense]